MATDLFSEYYNNPKKASIYSNIICNTPSADDLSFDIMDSDGVISNNVEKLLAVDLSDVHVPLRQYSSEMKVIDPHSFIYVKGYSSGASYMRKSFGCLHKTYDASILEDTDWQYNSSITFVIKYDTERGRQAMAMVQADGSPLNTFIEACQEFFDTNKIPINVSIYEDDDDERLFIDFSATQTGYSFGITRVVLWYDYVSDRVSSVNSMLRSAIAKTDLKYGFNDEWIEKHVPAYMRDDITKCVNVYTSTVPNRDYAKVYSLLTMSNGFIETNDIEYSTEVRHLVEDISRYVPAFKYKNGAFKGVLVKAIYPKYNAELITSSMRSLKLAHISDRFEEYVTTKRNEYFGLPLCVRTIKDVSDSLHSDKDIYEYEQWSGIPSATDKWIKFDKVPRYSDDSLWESSNSSDVLEMSSMYTDEILYDTVGLYGYCTYLTKNGLWSNFGKIYLCTAEEDDQSENTRNLIPSFIIYNPNDFPVEVNYMTFV